MGTYQIAVLAKASKKPFYVVAESHKFVRLFPLNQFDLPVPQNVLNFTTEHKPPHSPTREAILDEGGLSEIGKRVGKRSAPLVDFTGPELITVLISEGGILTPSAVSEELIKIYS